MLYLGCTLRKNQGNKRTVDIHLNTLPKPYLSKLEVLTMVYTKGIKQKLREKDSLLLYVCICIYIFKYICLIGRTCRSDISDK